MALVFEVPLCAGSAVDLFHQMRFARDPGLVNYEFFATTAAAGGESSAMSHASGGSCPAEVLVTTSASVHAALTCRAGTLAHVGERPSALDRIQQLPVLPYNPAKHTVVDKILRMSRRFGVSFGMREKAAQLIVNVPSLRSMSGFKGVHHREWWTIATAVGAGS